MASIDDISQRLECSLCFELMTEPKQLSCSHTFCECCLNHLYKCRNMENVMSCPTCRQTTRLKDGDVSKLQTNFPIKAMVGDLQGATISCTVCDPKAKSIASVYCQTCTEYLCESCLKSHGRYRINANHEVVDVDDIRQRKVKVKRFCHDHPHEEKLWVCTTCNISICLKCRMLDHSDSNHKLDKVCDFQKRMKDHIESLKKKAEEKVKSFERHIQIIKDQNIKIEKKIDEMVTEINLAYKESVKQLTKRKNDLVRQCDEYKFKMKIQLRDINEASQICIACIKSASDLVSNGVKTVLEGDTLAVHNNLCSELEHMVGKEGPDESKAMAITRQAEDIEFTRYRRERALDLGHVMRKTMWQLTNTNRYPLSGNTAYDIRPTPDGGMAVGYWDRGIEIFTVYGRQQMLLKSGKVMRFCFLTDYRFVVRDWNQNIMLYTPAGKQLPVKFKTNIDCQKSGLCADTRNNIYVGYLTERKIEVFRPEGGAPIMEIPCHGYGPYCIRHMNHSPLLVVADGSTKVRVIDKEGTVEYDVTKDGYKARVAIMRDDSIMIGWLKDGILSIDLYTPKLDYVRTVLTEFTVKLNEHYFAEFSTGEIGFPDKNNLYIFVKK